ncbi:MAG: M48 family metallopeptidase [Desulfosarcinaceae bacterium]|nr:M48 family metallopeptidase [Desulfosarcinaceae bacterium]
MKYTPRLPERNDNVSPASPIKELAVLAGGLLAAIVGIYLLLGIAVDIIVPRLSPAVEQRLAGPFLRTVSHFDDAAEGTRARVQRLLDRLQTDCAELPFPLQVHVKAGQTINALAFPGGHIVIFQGLLDEVASENELAFVLAHEMGHYIHRDHLRGIGRALVFITVSTLTLGPDSPVANVLGSALNLTEMRFSRAQETRADTFGLDALHCLYGHVGGSTDFFQKIPADQDPGRFGHYFASHPENRRRIDHLEEMTRARGYVSAPPIPFSSSE